MTQKPLFVHDAGGEKSVGNKEVRLNGYHIIGFEVDGFKKLTAVNMKFNPEGGLIFIKGDNGQGKTSILDAFYWLFAGKSVVNHDVVKHGAEKCIGKVNMGDVMIERIISEGSPDRLKVMVCESEIRSPQRFLDKLFNELCFNPWPFLDQTPEKKLQDMMRFAGIDFSSINDEIAQNENNRLLLGRQLKSIGDIEPVDPVEQVDIELLLEEKNRIQVKINEELEVIRKFNREQYELSKRHDDLDGSIARTDKTIIELTQKITELEKAKIEFEAEKQSLPPVQPEKPVKSELSTDEIDTKISDASNINREYDKYQRYLEKTSEKNQIQKDYDYYQKKIESLREEKLEILRTADTRVPGLEIRTDGLYYNGTFSENLSDSEKMTLAAEISKLTRPKLKALFIDRGESIGKTRMGVLEKFAKKNNIQVFVTQVVDNIPDDIPANTFYIEEGRLVK